MANRVPPPPAPDHRPDGSQWASDQPFRGAPRAATSRSQVYLAAVLSVATFASLVAWATLSSGLGTTGIYFIAIPGFTAAAIALLPARTPPGKIGPERTTLIILLATALVLREGFICVIMASPIVFLTVAVSTKATAERNRMNSVLLLPLLLVLGALEGTVYELPAQTAVVEERTIDVAPAQVDAMFDATNAIIPEIRPLLFTLPFPEPELFDGTAAEVGDRQTISFSEGELVLRVTERSTDSVHFEVMENTTPIDNWYQVQTVAVSWHSSGEDPAETDLRIEIDYRRNLAPALYFEPLGRFGLGEMAEVIADMIEVNAGTAEIKADSTEVSA